MLGVTLKAVFPDDFLVVLDEFAALSTRPAGPVAA